MGINVLGFSSNSEYLSAVDFGKRGCGVSPYSKRGTTQTMVKAPKCQLSVKGLRVSMHEDSEEVGSEAATL